MGFEATKRPVRKSTRLAMIYDDIVKRAVMLTDANENVTATRKKEFIKGLSKTGAITIGMLELMIESIPEMKPVKSVYHRNIQPMLLNEPEHMGGYQDMIDGIPELGQFINEAWNDGDLAKCKRYISSLSKVLLLLENKMKDQLYQSLKEKE